MLPPYLWTGVERWMLKSDSLVCENNATKAQPVTNCNFGLINSISFNYEMNLPISWENFCNSIAEHGWLLTNYMRPWKVFFSPALPAFPGYSQLLLVEIQNLRIADQSQNPLVCTSCGIGFNIMYPRSVNLIMREELVRVYN